MKFDFASNDWVMFVMNNRNKNFNDSNSHLCNFDNKYDLVIGTVANDDLAILFRNFVKGYIDFESLVKGMKYKRLSNQYSFHSEKVRKYLTFIGGVSRES